MKRFPKTSVTWPVTAPGAPSFSDAIGAGVIASTDGGAPAVRDMDRDTADPEGDEGKCGQPGAAQAAQGTGRRRRAGSGRRGRAWSGSGWRTLPI